MIRVAVAGCGTWGLNLVRVLASRGDVCVVALVDPLAEARAKARAIADSAETFASLTHAFAAAPDAVVVASPSCLHAELALEAIDRGCDVFVEKPLALTAVDAVRCADAAAANARIGMVGHLLRYHPTLVELVAFATAGGLGRLTAFESRRHSVHGSREAQVAWTLAPHDVSLLFALDASSIEHLDMTETENGDRARIEMELASGLVASMSLARAETTKERTLHLRGEIGEARFDDVKAPDRFVVRGIDGAAIEHVVPWREPLALEIDHFLARVGDRQTPRTPLGEGVAVVRALARAHASESTAAARPSLAESLEPVPSLA